MSAQHVAAAKRMYAARNRGDIEAVLAECDPEVEWYPHLASLGGNPVRGHGGVRRYMLSLRDDWNVFRHDPEDFIEVGDKVVALLNTVARGQASGVDVEVAVAHVLTFRDGKVLRYVSYHDRDEALRLARS